MNNVWLDGMMGLVVGDALGVPVQFLHREQIRERKAGPVVGMEAGGVYEMPEGTWSDDSSMALANLSSLLELGEVDAAHIMTQFVKWLNKGEYTPFGEAFDQGNTCTAAIYSFARVPDVMSCGCVGERSNGNGSLMRILPTCMYYSLSGVSDMDAIAGIDLVGGLTHNHTRSKICCGMYYFMVRNILEAKRLGKQPELGKLLQKAIDEGLAFYGQNIDNLTELVYLNRLFNLYEFKDVKEELIRSSGYVVDSLEAAVWCLLTTNSYKECTLTAVNLGDDTDTIAAIAGGLAGLYYGYEKIPKEWISVIKRREWLNEQFDAANERWPL